MDLFRLGKFSFSSTMMAKYCASRSTEGAEGDGVSVVNKNNCLTLFDRFFFFFVFFCFFFFRIS